jgi:nucleoside-diphosphate-sugar epimerase
MKILLIGGLGFIGRRFMTRFSGSHEFIVYVTPETFSRVKKMDSFANVSIEEGNVEDKKVIDVISKYKPDIVIHLAALTGLKKCHDNPEKAFRTNVYGTFNVVNGCIKSESKIIFISSREVYGETTDNTTKEDDPLIPNNTYGLTKMLGESLVKLAGIKHNLDYTILRLTNVYGPGGDQYGAQVIIRDAITAGEIRILGGEQKLNYIYVDDVVDLLSIVLTNKQASREAFNVGSKDTIRIKDFVTSVSKIIEEEIKLQYLPMRETETCNFEPDLTKIKKLLGFEAKTSLEEGIRKTIEWYKIRHIDSVRN